MGKRVSVLILSLMLSLLLLTSLAYGGPSDVLQVSFIDVGQGNAIWLRVSDSTKILIGAGQSLVVARLQPGYRGSHQ